MKKIMVSLFLILFSINLVIDDDLFLRENDLELELEFQEAKPDDLLDLEVDFSFDFFKNIGGFQKKSFNTFFIPFYNNTISYNGVKSKYSLPLFIILNKLLI